MKTNIKRIVLTIFLAFLFFSFAPPVLAGPEHNVSGWAWSENIGWISFNSTSSGAAINYGVHIDPPTGNFSGFAWSANIGWIHFAPPGPYPAAPLHSARLDLVTNRVNGWARALAHGDGWSGWISMSGTAPDYRVFRSECNLTSFAWGSDVVGWVEFRQVVTTFCANRPPAAVNLRQARVTSDIFCSANQNHQFDWSFSDPDPGDTQGAHQLQISTSSAFTTLVFDSGRVDTPSTRRFVEVRASPGPNQLTHNTTYFWRVMVWDNRGAVSVWASAPSFTTPRHQPPLVVFSHSPTRISVGEVITFRAERWDAALGATTTSRTFDGTVPFYTWTFPGGSPSIATSSAIATTTFATTGAQTVSLRIDDSRYHCIRTENINVRVPLPEWREIPPFGMARIFLASVINRAWERISL